MNSWIKQVAVNDKHRCHRKHREPIVMTPFWRLTVSLNDDPEHLMVLPPLDESLRDKITLLRCRYEPMPMPTGTPKEKGAFWAALKVEFPAFTHFLLNEWTPPPGIIESRFGVGHFHNPAILEALSDQSPEKRLLDLIDMELFCSPAPSTTKMRAIDVEKQLTQWDSNCKREAGKLLNFGNAAGAYLGRLAKSHPDRVRKDCVKGGTQWWALIPPD